MKDQSGSAPVTTTPYGAWPSPICLDRFVTGVVRLSEPAIHNNRMYWLETRPQDNGRSVLVEKIPDCDKRDITASVYSVRSRVHEYGGGSYLVGDHCVWFVNDEDQDIYRQHLETGVTSRLTKQPDKRFADLILDRRNQRLIAVCEDHTAAGEPDNSLVAIDINNGAIKSLVTGMDFYSNPALSNDGKRLAFISWNHPNLPWDTSVLWLTDIDDDGAIAEPMQISRGENESVYCPVWSPDNRLYFASDRTQWWNLYCWDGEQITAVNEEQAECALPQWVFGVRTFGFVDANNIGHRELCKRHLACASLGSKQRREAPHRQRYDIGRRPGGFCKLLSFARWKSRSATLHRRDRYG